MAFVTRCPYCGCIWRLPNKQMAEVGPVKCSACQHSFDATSQLLEVPDALFTPPSATVTMASAVPPTKSSIINNQPADETQQNSKPNTVTPADPIAMPQTASTQKKMPLVEPQNDPLITKASGMEERIEPQPPQDPDLIRIHPLDSEPHLGNIFAAESTQSKHHAQPPAAISNIVPAQEKMSEGKTIDDDFQHIRQAQEKPSRIGAFISVVLMILLVAIIVCVCAVIFNRRIAAAIPQTERIFHSVCQKITCPGFYLHDITAFIVTKTQLKAIDKAGNYILDVSIINGSRTAQAVPSLELELVDDTDTTLQHRLLRPSEYLLDPDRTPSVAPDRTLSVRINLKTNVAASRCIVRPVYSK